MVVDQLARMLVARGHEVTHIAAASVRRGESPGSAPPYKVIRIPTWNPLEGLLGVPYPLFHPQQLRRALRGEIAHADVVHVHGMLYKSSVLALGLARRLRPDAGRILTEHVGHVPYESRILDATESLAIHAIGRRTARTAQTIITLNGRVTDQMHRLAPDIPVVEIPNGVDLQLYRPPSAGERERLRQILGWDRRPRVLFVGRLVEKKGAHLAVEAARSAGDRFELVIVGPGSLQDLPSNVKLLGSQPRERVAEIYRACDVFVMPSRGEGFPLTVQEAMASGLPVVIAEDPAYRTTLGDSGRAACLVQPDPSSILAAIRELLEVGSEAGSEAAQFARSRFSWECAADRHVELYEELHTKSGVPASVS